MLNKDNTINLLLEAEMNRLSSTAPNELNVDASTLGTVRFLVDCPGNAGEVLTKVLEILKIIVKHSLDGWSTNNNWSEVLPQWFIGECAPEMSPDEAQQWLQWWKSLDAETQDKVEQENKWSLSDWLHWLEPSQRKWFWWGAKELSQEKLLVAVEVIDWPFAWGALTWLFKASGAEKVEPEK
jgi:hypothetical protein